MRAQQCRSWTNENAGYLSLVGHPGLVAGVTLTLVLCVGRPALLVHTVRVGVAVRTEILEHLSIISDQFTLKGVKIMGGFYRKRKGGAGKIRNFG